MHEEKRTRERSTPPHQSASQRTRRLHLSPASRRRRSDQPNVRVSGAVPCRAAVISEMHRPRSPAATREREVGKTPHDTNAVFLFGARHNAAESATSCDSQKFDFLQR